MNVLSAIKKMFLGNRLGTLPLFHDYVVEQDAESFVVVGRIRDHRPYELCVTDQRTAAEHIAQVMTATRIQADVSYSSPVSTDEMLLSYRAAVHRKNAHLIAKIRSDFRLRLDELAAELDGRFEDVGKESPGCAA